MKEEVKLIIFWPRSRADTLLKAAEWNRGA